MVSGLGVGHGWGILPLSCWLRYLAHSLPDDGMADSLGHEGQAMTCPICGNKDYTPLGTWKAICLTIIAMGAIMGILWVIYEVTG